jgi:molybdate transport system substrate-binding protein
VAFVVSRVKEKKMRCLRSSLLVLALSLAAGAANAGEFRVVASVGVRAILSSLVPDFEKASGHKVELVFGTAVPLKRQIDSGEGFDVAILVPSMLEDLARTGKVAKGSVANVAKTGVGVAVKRGAPKPDVSSPAAIEKAILASANITYTRESQTSAVIIPMLNRLGIAEKMAPRTLLETGSSGTASNIADGRADLGFILISEILPIPGIELAGPLPPELQQYVVFTAGISASTQQAEAAQAFVDYLRTPAAAAVLRESGMEPG